VGLHFDAIGGERLLSEFPENSGGLLVADSTGLMAAMQYIAERKSLRKNLHNNFCHTGLFLQCAKARTFQCANR
jgi:hypothetical protein